METKQKKQKTFDAVKSMRSIRDQISEETKDMNLKQLKKYIAEKLKKSPLKALGR